MPLVQKTFRQMTAKKSGTAGDEYAHSYGIWLWLVWKSVNLPAKSCMKTQNSSFVHKFLVGFLICALPVIASGQTGETQASFRPDKSDASSLQLISNFLKVTGGVDERDQLMNVVATGRIKESTLERRFELIETSDGKRYITYEWKHLGRAHRVVHVHDGLESWKQVIKPKKEEPLKYQGTEGRHFGQVLWLLPPFTLPRRADYVFQFQGSSKVKGRPAYLIKGFGEKNLPAWFYFDKESFLLTRWGGIGSVAGIDEYVDYQATKFRRVEDLIFPSEIDLVIENDVYGRVVFETIRTNQNLDEVSFFMPNTTVPTLRQRPVSSD